MKSRDLQNGSDSIARQPDEIGPPPPEVITESESEDTTEKSTKLSACQLPVSKPRFLFPQEATYREAAGCDTVDIGPLHLREMSDEVFGD